MTSTTVTRCSFIVVALLLGLARAQEGGDDEPQAAQLRGNDDANAVLKRVDDVLDKEKLVRDRGQQKNYSIL